jgi:hypothetical protein
LNNARSMVRDQTFVSQELPLWNEMRSLFASPFSMPTSLALHFCNALFHSRPREACAVSLKQAIRTAAKVRCPGVVPGALRMA